MIYKKIDETKKAKLLKNLGTVYAIKTSKGYAIGQVADIEERLGLYICRIFSINEEWLKTGNGEMKSPDEDEEAAYVSDLLEDTDNDLYDLIKAIMKTYCESSESDKMILKSFAKNLKSNLDK